ncbi:hypothetical protein BDZ91DRAFT_653526 [Kalaharituber pfeilii]|nr:hypothetical protein BDZ91DRAFT_653526 [Kalaharituber pfeilii]
MKIFSAFVGLQSTCLNPEGKPYIHSIRVGANNSPEPFSGGTTHGVVMTFSSTEDRDYYVNDDPVHNEFKKVLAPFVDPPPEGSFRVVDFTDGEL